MASAIVVVVGVGNVAVLYYCGYSGLFSRDLIFMYLRCSLLE